MNEHHHQAAVSDFTTDGAIHIKTIGGEHLVIALGPAQIISLKQGVDRYVAKYELAENANKSNEPYGIVR